MSLGSMIPCEFGYILVNSIIPRSSNDSKHKSIDLCSYADVIICGNSSVDTNDCINVVFDSDAPELNIISYSSEIFDIFLI